MTISVDWPTVTIIPNCILFFSLNECHFFPEFELQQERTARRIGDPFTIGAPLKLWRSECGDGSVEFGADDGDGVWGIVAVFVEGRSRKIVLRGAKQQLKCGGSAQLHRIPQNIQIYRSISSVTVLQQIFIFCLSLRILLQNFRINPQRK